MTDPDLIRKKLAAIETYVSELRRLARPAELGRDVREERFVEHTLQLAIQAAIDVASHIVSDERLGEPTTNRELFDLLQKAGHVSGELAGTLRNMAGFRKRACARLRRRRSGHRPRHRRAPPRRPAGLRPRDSRGDPSPALMSPSETGGLKTPPGAGVYLALVCGHPSATRRG